MFILEGGRLDANAASRHRIRRGFSRLLAVAVDKSALFVR
jgi:hypothetical protein